MTFHGIKKTGIEPKDFFEAIYLSILGKMVGLKLDGSWSVMDKDFLIRRFEEVI